MRFSLSTQKKPVEKDNIPFLQMRTLRPGEVK